MIFNSVYPLSLSLKCFHLFVHIWLGKSNNKNHSFFRNFFRKRLSSHIKSSKNFTSTQEKYVIITVCFSLLILKLLRWCQKTLIYVFVKTGKDGSENVIKILEGELYKTSNIEKKSVEHFRLSLTLSLKKFTIILDLPLFENSWYFYPQLQLNSRYIRQWTIFLFFEIF